MKDVVTKAVPSPMMISLEPEGGVALDRGIVVSIHRAPVQGRRVTEVRAALERAVASSSGPLLSLAAFRLCPEFPIDIGAGDNRAELAQLLRTLDRSYAASATIIEFGGIRGATMRLLSKAVIALVRPRAEMQQFDSLTDAVAWLQTHAARVGAPTDAGSYIRLYREVDRQLAELDVRRGADGRVRTRA